MPQSNRRVKALAEEIVKAVSSDRDRNITRSGWGGEKSSVLLAARQNHTLGGIEGEWSFEEKLQALEQVSNKCVEEFSADVIMEPGTGNIFIHFLSPAEKLKRLANSK